MSRPKPGPAALLMAILGILGLLSDRVRAADDPQQAATQQTSKAALNPNGTKLAEATPVPTRRIEVRGTCLDENSKPVSKTVIYVLWKPGDTGPLEVTGETVLKKDGTFQFRRVETEMPLRRDLIVVATANGYVPQKMILDQDNGGEIELSFVLKTSPGAPKGLEDPELQLGEIKPPDPLRRPGKRHRVEGPASQLLDQLHVQNHGAEQFMDPWLQTLKEIVDLGPDAVPELIEELDETDDNVMLRCLGFLLRAIGDKRAVPALIRAIPKLLQPSGSDMWLISNNPDLIKFVRLHNRGEHDPDNHYSFGRPINEIQAALHRLTGQKFDDSDLPSMSAGGFPSQQRAKEKLYQRNASQWADWWEQHWKEYVQDKTYSRVNLVVADGTRENWELKPGMRFKTVGTGSNFLLESIFNLKAKRVFYDFDTGRHGQVPEKWRTLKTRINGQPNGRKSIETHLAEILAWAAGEGFDMFGTEYVSPNDGQRYYALRPIGMRIWQIDPKNWKPMSPDFTLEEVQAAGMPVEGWLLPFDSNTKTFDPKGPALFLYVTRDGTPGLVKIGIEVQDTNYKTGVQWLGDNELNPVHFMKGRRFGWTSLADVPSTRSE